MILVTKGADGAEGFWGGYHIKIAAYPQPRTVDTTGAGDTFFGCCLAKILENGLEDPDEKVLEDMIRFANAAASIITSKKGALRCMPSEQEILKLIGEPHIDKEIKFTFS